MRLWAHWLPLESLILEQKADIRISLDNIGFRFTLNKNFSTSLASEGRSIALHFYKDTLIDACKKQFKSKYCLNISTKLKLINCVV